MKVLIANQDDVTALMPMAECIGVMEEALKLLAAGDALLPLRSMMVIPGAQNLLGLMPSYLGGIGSLGVKVIAVFPGNQGTEYDSHQGVVLLFDSERGLLRAIVDGTAVTAIRTAAVSGAATKALARADASDLAIIGAGTQASTHLAAMLAVRPIRRVRVYSDSMAGTQQYVARESKRHGITVEPVASAESAVRGADIICTATTSDQPVVLGEWLSPGCHINAVGAYTPTTRELDTAAVVRSRMFVDRLEATLKEAGDFLIPRSEGAVNDDHIVGELGQVLLGDIGGRRSDDEITVFKSLGIAVEDLASAHYILRKAEATGRGMWVEMGGRHFGSA